MLGVEAPASSSPVLRYTGQTGHVLQTYSFGRADHVAHVHQASSLVPLAHPNGRTQRRLGRLLALLWFVLLTSVVAWEVTSEVPLVGQVVTCTIAVGVLLLAILALWRWPRPMGWVLITVAPALSILFPLFAANIGLHPIGLVLVDVLCLMLPSLAGGMLLLNGHRRVVEQQATDH